MLSKETMAFRNHEPGSRCPVCKLERTPEGHDPCLGTLPGVKFACCGHGYKRGYIYFTNGIIIRFRSEAIEYVDEFCEDIRPKLVLSRLQPKPKRKKSP
jgi:hypothetical protein